MKSVSYYLKSAFQIYVKRENFIFFAKISAIIILVSLAINYFLQLSVDFQAFVSIVNQYFLDLSRDTNSVDNQSYLVSLSQLNWNIIFSLIFIAFIFKLFSDSVMFMSLVKMGGEVGQIFKLGFSRMFKFFALNFIYILLLSIVVFLNIVVFSLIVYFMGNFLPGYVFFSFALLLIGLIMFLISIFTTYNIFSAYLVADMNLGVFESIGKIPQYLKGKFWEFFVKFIVVNLIMFIFNMAVNNLPEFLKIYALNLRMFIYPITMLPAYLLYKDVVTSFNKP